MVLLLLTVALVFGTFFFLHNWPKQLQTKRLSIYTLATLVCFAILVLGYVAAIKLSVIDIKLILYSMCGWVLLVGVLHMWVIIHAEWWKNGNYEGIDGGLSILFIGALGAVIFLALSEVSYKVLDGQAYEHKLDLCLLFFILPFLVQSAVRAWNGAPPRRYWDEYVWTYTRNGPHLPHGGRSQILVDFVIKTPTGKISEAVKTPKHYSVAEALNQKFAELIEKNGSYKRLVDSGDDDNRGRYLLYVKDRWWGLRKYLSTDTPITTIGLKLEDEGADDSNFVPMNPRPDFFEQKTEDEKTFKKPEPDERKVFVIRIP